MGVYKYSLKIFYYYLKKIYTKKIISINIHNFLKISTLKGFKLIIIHNVVLIVVSIQMIAQQHNSPDTELLYRNI